MSHASTQHPSAVTRDHRATLVGGLFALALLLAVRHVHDALDGASLWSALTAAHPLDLREILTRDSLLPRIAMTLLCGAALGLAGTLTQQALRNPLAEPMTLGVFPGAYLALMVAALWAPQWLSAGREPVALAGGALAMLLVFGLAWPQRMSPLGVILAGMIVSLYCGAISLAIAMAHFDLLQGLMIWGGGSLDQSGWQASRHLLAGGTLCSFATWLLRRPLDVFDAGDSTARNLGIPVGVTRFCALLIAVALTACVVSAVGVIGFVGLAAPTLVKLAGARRLRQRLVWAPLLGAALLWATDELVRTVSSVAVFSAHLIPTGTVTSLLGVPLLLALLPRLRSRPAPDAALHATAISARPGTRASWRFARFMPPFTLLALACVLSLTVSRDADGWRFASLPQWDLLLFWRLPHLASALAAGVLLAVAGTLMQRTTANPMASPDLLGVGSGGALGIVVTLFVVAQPGPGALFAGCVAGALLTLLALMTLAQRASFAPERLLLTGIAVSALFQAVVGAVMASGDPRAGLMMNFVVGSTYYVAPAAAWSASAVAVLALCVAPFTARWVLTLGLGAPAAASLGVPVPRARFLVLLFASTLVATATLLVGPLSFVGLIAPHIARLSGGRRPLAQLYLSALTGGALMVFAEWLGRQLAFPQEMPAGLVATLLGGPCVIALAMRRSRAGPS
ncbi:Fe(3+)-hydroxamate ABC transporter permease FhuB [Paraburkholderia sp. D15]|uniref:Fe(3+)-hydroxamate ABC transporter permease FhuB n=1 Tax=Paraburkholderia sp. D15 TaxID=2880218 RepID=UPI00247A73BF|nr:Fe(3+)-hydroxamate ABC transporter permease FhuB [Paraburkholderia sp. D15]WGS52777.1 Fe(3+)-hydroxamate ABC transporter permease FhuB [Paraburkholderia sp. D15]